MIAEPNDWLKIFIESIVLLYYTLLTIIYVNQNLFLTTIITLLQ